MPERISAYDVCIIGSGAGGAPVAYTLASHGVRVALMERGPALQPRSIRKDELTACRMHLFRPDEQRGKREILYGDADPVTSNHLWNSTCVGGGTRTMSGFFLPMQEHDFKSASLFGIPEGSTVTDWPISIQDLERFYTQVEIDIGISGLGEKTPQRRTRPFPIPPLESHPAGSLIDDACAGLGYHPFPTPRAVLSTDFQGRAACSYSGLCGSYGCLTGAKGSMHETYVKRAVETGNCTLFEERFVFRLESTGDRVTGAIFYDKNHRIGIVEAPLFILACGAIETARLLLNSHSAAHPQGLANSSGQVGKNLSFQMPCEVTGFFPKNLFPGPAEAPSPFVQRTIQDFHILSGTTLQYIRGGSVIFLFPHPNPIQRIITLSYDERGGRVIGAPLREKIKGYFSFHHLTSDTFIEFLPNIKTRVTLSRTVRDWWGVPAARIEIQPHPCNTAAASVIASRIAQLFKAMGAAGYLSNLSPFTAGEIQQGTCRFGEDPKQSVLDPFCRSHDIKNLFITDAGFMPSGLPVPSTWTIIANSLRVGEHIARRRNTL